MFHYQFSRVVAARALLGLLLGTASAQDTWCGKVYNGSAQIIPGGFLSEPEVSTQPLLDVQVVPRYSFNIEGDRNAEFIVDAVLSPYHGSPYTAPPTTEPYAPDFLDFTITIQDKAVVTASIEINTSDVFALNFSLPALFFPNTTALPITLTGTTKNGGSYAATSKFLYLPGTSEGSLVRIDRLYGTLLRRSKNTNGLWEPFFPYGYYGSYGPYFSTPGTPTAFANDGFNALNVVSDFADGNMTYTLDEMDKANLMLQYDMRNSYQNLTSVAEQIPLVKSHPCLLTYYTADEPDGWGYTSESTDAAYKLLAELDPYHPNALVLNCQNHYFGEYTAGADIIMEDAYPVGANMTYTSRWNTPCNLTYGDCGCDNCEQSLDLLNVARRIDDFRKYATWLGGAAILRKPIWSVPQAFSSPDEYWSREPTAEEAWVMDFLAFNHGAKGRLAWIYPASDVLGNATSQLAKVVTVYPVVNYLTKGNPVLIQDATAGNSSLDVAYWTWWGAGHWSILVSVANAVNSAVAGPVQITLPDGYNLSMIHSQPWGNVSWTFEGTTLVAADGLAGLETSYVIVV